MNQKKGILLVNLGTPDSPAKKDVFRYLTEFLTDARVITYSWLKRQLLVRGVIIPARLKQSSAQYQELWSESGASPLMFYGKKVEKMLQESLGDEYKVVLAMRYQNPSIEKGLKELEQINLSELVILPLFPQYASATTGSVYQEVMDKIKNWTVFPKLTFINHYFDHPLMIDAFCSRARQENLEKYDEFLFSFHGLPEVQIKNADKSGCCLKPGCCEKMNSKNKNCYKAQCYETARAIAKKLNLSPEKYQIAFQSRLGKDPWIEPFTSEIIHGAAKRGVKNLLVFSPAFICDCLETLYEIKKEYGKEFRDFGGETLTLVEGLNDHPLWISALKSIVE